MKSKNILLITLALALLTCLITLTMKTGKTAKTPTDNHAALTAIMERTSVRSFTSTPCIWVK